MLNIVRVMVLAAFSAIATAQQTGPDEKAGGVGSEAARAEGKATPRARLQSDLDRRTWSVEGLERIALVHVPTDGAETEMPVVFAFHGHGGGARQASRSFRLHTLWPAAIVVYMEGVPTPGALTDPEGKRNGWQNRSGLHDDRDLKFFDAVLATLRTDYKVDAARIFAMGHSNGGGFTYLLWKERPEIFAAFAPSGSFTLEAPNLTPKPALHIAGKADELVKFRNQERTIEAIRKVNGCAEAGTAWAEDCTMYASTTRTPLVTLVHEGGHKYPKEAPALIVKFFKEQQKADAEHPAQTPE